MIQRLGGAHILVADDQLDVARTLCRPLQKAGARLRFVTDGQAALREISSRPFDLIIIDMKMPPEEWGGLWLLRQLREDSWRIPSLVLSGEGSKQQLIQATRQGATDWIDKDQAAEELLERCAHVLSERLAQAFTFAENHLPSPLAYRFARYGRTADPEKKITEGLHTLESIFRFAAILGLSTTPPAALRGITLARLAAPSMGTWFDITTSLAKLPHAGSDFTRMLSWLAPGGSDHQLVREIISARNDLAHGRSTPTADQAAQLDALLSRFAYRAASSWRANLMVQIGRAAWWERASKQVIINVEYL
jgi:CheY-like chemotaxis protein